MNIIYPIIGMIVTFCASIIILKIFNINKYCLISLAFSLIYFCIMLPTIYILNNNTVYKDQNRKCKVTINMLYNDFNSFNRYNPFFVFLDNSIKSNDCSIIEYCYKTSATYSLYNKCFIDSENLKKGK